MPSARPTRSCRSTSSSGSSSGARQASDALAAGDVRTLSSLRDAVRADAREIEERLARELDDERDYAAARPRVRELTFLAKLADDHRRDARGAERSERRR